MKLDQILDDAQTAADEGRFDDVLAKIEEALKIDPASVEALEIKAIALGELGQIDEADELWAKLIAENPEDPGMSLSAAHAMIRGTDEDEGDRDRVDHALSLLEPLTRSKDEELRFDALLLTAIALNRQGEVQTAEQAARAAVKLQPDDVDARLELSFSLFEQAKFDDAKQRYQAVADDVPDDPTAWYHLGLIAERAGDQKLATEHFVRATELDGEAYPHPTHLSEDEFDAAVQAAIDELPEQAKAPLQNATIAVEPLPTDEDLDGGRLSPSMLGIFHGTPIDERSPIAAEHHATAVIKLFQKNLERFARNRDELIEQIGVTLLHEVGHLMGLDEDELYERGLD